MKCIEGCGEEATHGSRCRTCHNKRNRDAQKRFRDGVVATHRCEEEGCEEQIPLTRRFCDCHREKRAKLHKKAKNAQRYLPAPDAHKVEPVAEVKTFSGPINAEMLMRRRLSGCIVKFYDTGSEGRDV